jgi:hypothetical protein
MFMSQKLRAEKKTLSLLHMKRSMEVLKLVLLVAEVVAVIALVEVRQPKIMPWIKRGIVVVVVRLVHLITWGVVQVRSSHPHHPLLLVLVAREVIQVLLQQVAVVVQAFLLHLIMMTLVLVEIGMLQGITTHLAVLVELQQ